MMSANTSDVSSAACGCVASVWAMGTVPKSIVNMPQHSVFPSCIVCSHFCTHELTHSFPHSDTGECCVHITTQRGNVAILRHLVHVCKADLNAREGRAGYTALHIATETQNRDVFEFLIKECSEQLDLEMETFGRRTAYQVAALNADEPAMRALRRSGAEALDPSDDELDDDESVDSSGSSE